MLRFRVLSSALVFPALVLPTLVDLAFVLRAADSGPVETLASLAPALAFLWLLGGFVVAYHITEHHTPDSPQRPIFSVVPLAVASVAAIAAWMLVVPLFDIITGAAGISRIGQNYAQLRLTGLPILAALVPLRLQFDGHGSWSPVLWGALALNALNIGLNAALLDGHIPGVAPSVSGLAIATVVSYAAGLAVAIGVAIRRNIKFFELHWPSTKSITDDLWKRTRSASLRVTCWSIPLLSIVGLLSLAIATDRAALATAVEWATTSAPALEFAPSLTNSLDAGPHRLLIADWTAELARSRPPLYLAASTLVVAASSLVIAFAVGVADAATGTRSNGDGGNEISGATSARDIATALAVVISVPALAIFLAPHKLLSPLTTDSHLVATAAPALRIVFAWLPLVGIATVVITSSDNTAKRRLLGFITLGSAASLSTAYLLSLVLEVGFMGIWWGFTLTSAAWMTAMTIDYFRRPDPRDD